MAVGLWADMDAREMISNNRIVSKCGWTPYDGMEVQGKVMMTLVRGTVVAEDGKPVAESGYGQFIPRLGTQSECKRSGFLRGDSQ
jgi:hypothetical protein